MRECRHEWMEPSFLACGLPSPLAGKFPLWYKNSHEECSPWSPVWGRLPKGIGESMWQSPGLPFYNLQRLAHSRQRPECWGLSWNGLIIHMVYFSGKEDFSHIRPLISPTSRLKYSKQVVSSLRFSMLLMCCLYNFGYLYKNICDIFPCILTWWEMINPIGEWMKKTNKQKPPVVINPNWLGLWKVINLYYPGNLTIFFFFSFFFSYCDTC